MFANCIIIVIFSIVQSAKILVVVPTPSLSHQVVLRPLVQKLINRSHEVTVITTNSAYPQGTFKNYTEINLHDLAYTILQLFFDEIAKIDQNDYEYINFLAHRKLFENFQRQLRDESVSKLIRDKTLKFDLLILEESVTPALIFSYIFNAPVILMSSYGCLHGNLEMIGAPAHPLLYPTHFHQRTYNLSMWEKIKKLYNHLWFTSMFKQQQLEDDKMLQNYLGPDTPPLSQLRNNNVHMMLLNIHPVWLHNPPIPPNVIYVWGIHNTPEKKLPKDLQTYLDSSGNGVIYISFGNNFRSSSMPTETLKIFIEVLSRLPYDVLWKWDMDELPGKSENIKISKWLPQCDILRHQNLKLFITQGGLQSTDEAIRAGVPLIGFPIFIDQSYNTEKYEHFKVGIRLHFVTLTIEKFENAIKTIFTNYESYHKNIIELRTQLYDQAIPSLEQAAWWVEYTVRHGKMKHLCAPAAEMSWSQYYELELVILVVSGIIFLAAVLLLTIRYFLKFTFDKLTIKLIYK